MPAITKATINDVAELTVLINNAYRGETSKKGWTTPADLVSGDRITEEVLRDYLLNKNITILKYTDDEGVIAGSVYLEQKGAKLYLGMISVSPLLQNNGIGRALMEEAEALARKLNCQAVTMTVILSRTELVSWYERKGYRLTGETQAFHHGGRHGDIKEEKELFVSVMEKEVD